MQSEPSSLLSIVDRTAYDRLVESIAEDLPEASQKDFREKARHCTDYAQARQLIELVLGQSAIIMARSSDRDIEGSYQVLISLLDRLTDNADLPIMVTSIVANLRASTIEKPNLRLKLLCNFYNLLKSGTSERFDVLIAIIEFARDTKQLEVLSEFFENLDEWKKNWRSLTVENERQLYLLISQTMESVGKPSDAHRFLIKYLATFGHADNLGSISDSAVKGVIGAVKEPISSLTSVSNLLSLKPIKQLNNDPAHKSIYRLLEVYSFGKLSDLLDYFDKNAAVLSKYSINKDKAIRDMRLLSLSLLASEYEEIPYTEISKTLQIPKDEVEDWVVHAITANLIEAKMDQKQELVMITRSTHRHFTKKDWVKLQDKLHSWQRNVKSLLETLKEDARSPA